MRLENFVVLFLIMFGIFSVSKAGKLCEKKLLKELSEGCDNSFIITWLFDKNSSIVLTTPTLTSTTSTLASTTSTLTTKQQSIIRKCCYELPCSINDFRELCA